MQAAILENVEVQKSTPKLSLLVLNRKGSNLWYCYGVHMQYLRVFRHTYRQAFPNSCELCCDGEENGVARGGSKIKLKYIRIS